MGAPTPQDNSTPPQAQQQTAGFSFVVPTEFVELPSGGRFYSETHPLHGQTTIEIKQMTAKEEDMLTSRTLLKSGVAIERVIQSLIMDKRINPDSMLVGDRNAVIIAARISGYGSDYNTSVNCPACGVTQEYGIDLHDANVYGGQNADVLGVVDNGNGTFTTTLPKTRVQATFRLLNGADEKNLVNQLENARKRKRPEQAITTQIRNMIVSVNGDDSVQALNYLIENIPSLDARHLRTCYREVAPNIDLTQVFQCGDCGHEQDMEVPLSADFFWPDR